MKIIDFNKKNKTLIAELSEEEYNILYMRQSITNVHTKWNEGELIIADDEIKKPQLNKDTLVELNDTISLLSKYLSSVDKLPDKAVFVSFVKKDIASALSKALKTLNQIKKEVERNDI